MKNHTLVSLALKLINNEQKFPLTCLQANWKTSLYLAICSANTTAGSLVPSQILKIFKDYVKIEMSLDCGFSNTEYGRRRTTVSIDVLLSVASPVRRLSTQYPVFVAIIGDSVGSQ